MDSCFYLQHFRMNCLLETGYIFGFTPPHYCRVGFLCLVLDTVRSRPPPPPPPPCQTQSFTQQLCHAESFTHTLSLSLFHTTTLSYTIFLTRTHTLSHRNIVIHNLSRIKTLSRGIFHTTVLSHSDIDICFAWQAWRLATSTFAWHGRRGACGAGCARSPLAARDVAALCVAGVALAALGHAIPAPSQIFLGTTMFRDETV